MESFSCLSWKLCFLLTLTFCLLVEIQSSLSDVTNDLFGGSKNGVVAAFGNFNADKLTDIFVLADDGKAVYLLQAEADVTKERAGFSRHLLVKPEEAGDWLMTSLAPGDFDGDAQMDLLVTKKKDGKAKDSAVTVQVYWGSSARKTLSQANSLILNTTLKDQPAIIDYNGDMIPDLLGESNDKGERLYFVFGKNRTYQEVKATNGSSSESLAPLRIPQSSAFFDFNGDLVPDLCVASEKEGRLQFEIWLNSNGNLIWSQTIVSPKEMKQFGRASFYDLNDNHEINIILPGCLNSDKGECKKSVVYVWGRGAWNDLHVKFDSKSTQWQLSMDSMMPWLEVPIMLRFGDFNLDGFPDALTVLKTSSNSSYAAFLMLNVASTANFSRTLHLDLDQPISSLSKQPPIAAFYDFMENGILDILQTVYVQKAPELRALEQDFTADAYFLKVMVVSGLCSDDCPNGHEPYGVNQVGPVIRFQTTTSTGDEEIGVSSQLSQSAYFSLQLPFEVFGLGQTPNFVDKLEVGIQNPPGTKQRQRSWPSIIPNAQVVVIPHPTSSPSRWRTKLYVTPSRLVLLTGLCLLGTGVFISFIIAVLFWRERVEDKKEKLQEAQRFHFDAM